MIKTKAGVSKYSWDYHEFLYLVSILRSAKDFKESLHLFLDLHTKQEIAEIIRRTLIASMLFDGLTYEEIQEQTGASSTTIAKVQLKISRPKSMLETTFKRTGSYSIYKAKKIRKAENKNNFITNTLKKHGISF